LIGNFDTRSFDATGDPLYNEQSYQWNGFSLLERIREKTAKAMPGHVLRYGDEFKILIYSLV